jgi:hypothetical protein
MNRLDKKQIFIGTILGIILSILTLILLTRNIQPLSAQQTTQKYTTFKTENQGFKFVRRELTSAYYEGENTKTNYGSAPTSDIGKRYYLYKRTGEVNGAPYPKLSCDTNDYTVNCPDGNFFESLRHFTSPPQYAGDTYRRGGIRTKQKVYTFIETVIVKPVYENKPAPIFAQTPTTTSPGNQVVTKEYLHSITDTILNTITKNPAESVYSGYLSLDYYTYVRDPSRDQSGHVGNRLPCDTSWRDKNCPDSYNVPTDLGEYAYDWDGGCSFFGGCWRYSYAYRRTNSQSIDGEFFRFDLLGFPYAMLVRHFGGAGYSTPIPMELFNEFCEDSAGCEVYIYQYDPFWTELGRCMKRWDNYIHCDWGETAAVTRDGDGVVGHLHTQTRNCYLTDAKVVNWNANDNATGLYLYRTGGNSACSIFIRDY